MQRAPKRHGLQSGGVAQCGSAWPSPCMFAVHCARLHAARRRAIRLRRMWKQGHMKFNRKALENYKKRGKRSTLVCSDCADRHQKIEGILRNKKSIKCTCPGNAKERVHNPNNEKCSLFPRFAGERRWPGSNMDVTLDDFQFCERMRRRQKT